MYLSLGDIRPYKSIDLLLQAYEVVRTPDTTLLVAGSCRDESLRMLLRNADVDWHDGRVPDEQLKVYFAAADVAVFAFRKITSSSSVILALSFGKPVIAPTVGDIALLPETTTYKFEPGRVDSLTDAMRTARQDAGVLREKTFAAFQYANALSWTAAAEGVRAALRDMMCE